jgi:carbon storage regulator
MLVLSRQLGEAITIDAVVNVRVLAVRGETVKLGIDAPRDVQVDRKEVSEAKAREGAFVTDVIA